MSSPNKNSMWLAGCFVAAVCLLIGAALGSMAGYLVAARAVTQASVQSPAEPVGLVVASPETTAGAAQPIVVNDQTSSAAAVSKVLPAVVTVVAQGQRGVGSGSGFFISQDGYVVTNNHVVEGAQEVAVIYAQGGRASAQLVGTAPDFDLAVLKVDGLVPAVAAWATPANCPWARMSWRLVRLWENIKTP